MNLDQKLKEIKTHYKAETEFMIRVTDLATDYLLSARGKTLPDLADFMLVIQREVEADFHEKAYRAER